MQIFFLIKITSLARLLRENGALDSSREAEIQEEANRQKCRRETHKQSDRGSHSNQVQTLIKETCLPLPYHCLNGYMEVEGETVTHRESGGRGGGEREKVD